MRYSCNVYIYKKKVKLYNYCKQKLFKFEVGYYRYVLIKYNKIIVICIYT